MNGLTRKHRGLATAFLTLTAVCLPAAVRASEKAAAPASSAAFPLSAAPAAICLSGNTLALPLAAEKVFSGSASAVAPEALPEAPMPAAAEASAFMFQSPNTGTAPKYALDIPSGWTAQRLSGGDKVVLGIRNLANVESLAGTVISSGYSHLTNGQPNYGTDGDAFAQRFGAGVARSASQDIFTNSVLAPILHQDPRYYVEGPGHSFFHRLTYAATRPIIGRTDSGRTTVNAALLIGYAGAAALTPTYYPPINRNFRDVAATYGSSIGGAAIGFGVSEFSDQILKAIHLKR